MSLSLLAKSTPAKIDHEKLQSLPILLGPTNIYAWRTNLSKYCHMAGAPIVGDLILTLQPRVQDDILNNARANRAKKETKKTP
jgi:hypothetical protein